MGDAPKLKGLLCGDAAALSDFRVSASPSGNRPRFQPGSTFYSHFGGRTSLLCLSWLLPSESHEIECVSSAHAAVVSLEARAGLVFFFFISRLLLGRFYKMTVVFPAYVIRG